MDPHGLDKLQFDHVRQAVAAHCACSLGKDLARRITPATRRDTIVRWFDQVRQMETAMDTVGAVPLGGVHDLAPELQAARQPAGLDAAALHRVSETLNATGNVTRWVASLAEDADLLRHIARDAGDFSAVGMQIDGVIDERGAIRDDASPRLRDIRRTIEHLRAEVGEVFARILRQPHMQKILQFPNATQRGDRTVLPLKTEYRGHLKGIVHQASDSGSTLFIEPAEAVQVNNAIVRQRDEERKEIIRILTELSLLVHRNEAGITATLRAVGVLDLIAAKVRFLKSRNGVCPDISEDRVLLLNQARHPVLLDLARADESRQRTVVPIDVRLGDDFDLLVITGPNTGGKTVTLKTIGLLVLMAQSGVPIPCGRGSRVPIYRQVHVDIGDEQSIEQSLSTFSSHLSNILTTLSRINPYSLVLLDELGSGTDPDEGAAIGRAVIDEMLRVGCAGVLTTHLSALKSIGIMHDRVDNASVEFDVESLRPTYLLRIGEPGNSNAITIAQRLGMPRRMVKNARKYLSKRGQAINKVIASTLDSRRQAERARLEAHQALLDAEQQRIHFEHEQRRLESERDAQQQWFDWVNDLGPGDEVYVKKFERNARVVRLRLQNQTALISAGAVDMEVPLKELDKPVKNNE
ncbi:MAG TPA: DNA strand exchange inhibitor protein [Phycisphaerae bacterium]|nr:DNA strand exchange inhibitor protein [Phycisphaerae bacterium]